MKIEDLKRQRWRTGEEEVEGKRRINESSLEPFLPLQDTRRANVVACFYAMPLSRSRDRVSLANDDKWCLSANFGKRGKIVANLQPRIHAVH